MMAATEQLGSGMCHQREVDEDEVEPSTASMG
jgi:hypothetical protein